MYILLKRTMMRCKNHIKLNNKIDDLENRSRRCNLRIIGIPETVKGHDLFKFLQTSLPGILQIQEACSDMVIERAHRLGPARQTPENRPCVVIFKTLSFLHKEAIWQASRKTSTGMELVYLYFKIILRRSRGPGILSSLFLISARK